MPFDGAMFATTATRAIRFAWNLDCLAQLPVLAPWHGPSDLLEALQHNGKSGHFLLNQGISLTEPGIFRVLPFLPSVDFEDFTVDYTMSDFGGNVSSLVEDPENSSNSVMQVVKTAGSETWAGTTIGTSDGFATNIPMSFSNSVMSVKVYAQSGVPVRLKIEDAANNTHTCETETNTTESGWQVVEFDFLNQAPGTELLSVGLDNGWVYNKASIFFDFNSSGNNETYYFDDVQMCDNGNCVTSECVQNGDATQDGAVNVADVVLIINHIIGTSVLSDTAFCSSDMNSDGVINVTDIIALVNIIIGM